MTIDYKETVRFEGRNGYFMCKGLSVIEWPDPETIEISPITSKGEVGRCMLQIPKDKIQEVIDVLKQHL